MIDCPFCGNEVPVGAQRCKHCFSELDAATAPQKKSGLLIGVVIFGLIISVSVLWLYKSIHNRNPLEKYTIDTREQRIVMVYRTSGETETRQIHFDEVASVEMEAGSFLLGGYHYELFLVTTAGERVLLKQSTETSLERDANDIAHFTNKQLTIINNIRAGRKMLGEKP